MTWSAVVGKLYSTLSSSAAVSDQLEERLLSSKDDGRGQVGLGPGLGGGGGLASTTNRWGSQSQGLFMKHRRERTLNVTKKIRFLSNTSHDISDTENIQYHVITNLFRSNA